MNRYCSRRRVCASARSVSGEGHVEVAASWRVANQLFVRFWEHRKHAPLSKDMFSY